MITRKLSRLRNLHWTGLRTMSLAAPAPVQTIAEIRDRTATLLGASAAYNSVSWAGLFGSFARSTHTPESDIDIIIAYNTHATSDQVFLAAGTFVEDAPDAFGRPVEVVHMMKPEVRSYLLVEALLTSVGIYGPEQWPREHIMQARHFLDDGYRRLTRAYELFQQIKSTLKSTDKEVTLALGYADV